MKHFAAAEEDVPTPRLENTSSRKEMHPEQKIVIKRMGSGTEVEQMGDDVVIKVKNEQTPESTEGRMTCALWIYLCLALVFTSLGAGLFMFAWKLTNQGMFVAQPQQAQ